MEPADDLPGRPPGARAVRSPAVICDTGALLDSLVAASIVALAEELGVTRLVTRDVRDLDTVRLADGRGFDLVVSPVRPEPAKRRRRRMR